MIEEIYGGAPASRETRRELHFIVLTPTTLTRQLQSTVALHTRTFSKESRTKFYSTSSYYTLTGLDSFYRSILLILEPISQHPDSHPVRPQLPSETSDNSYNLRPGVFLSCLETRSTSNRLKASGCNYISCFARAHHALSSRFLTSVHLPLFTW